MKVVVVVVFIKHLLISHFPTITFLGIMVALVVGISMEEGKGVFEL